MRRHLSNETVTALREALAEQLRDSGRLEEITVNGLTFLFKGDIDTSSTTVYTGVEHMGEKESYVKWHIRITGFALDGAYGPDGVEVSTDLDIGRLAMDSDDSCCRVEVVPAREHGRVPRLLRTVLPRLRRSIDRLIVPTPMPAA